MDSKRDNPAKVDEPRSPVVQEIKAEEISHDIGASLFLEAQQFSPEELAAARKTVLRKIDLHIMPIVCATHVITYPH